MFSEVKDSGQRQSFNGGAVRDTQDGKPMFGLLPVYALGRVATHYANGRKKYKPEQREGERIPVENWRRGMDTSRTMESLLRHAFAYNEGHRDEDHLSAVVFNAFTIMEHEEMVRRGILDPSILTLPDWTKPGGNAAVVPPSSNFFEPDLDACGTIDGVTPIPQDCDHEHANSDGTCLLCGDGAQPVFTEPRSPSSWLEEWEETGWSLPCPDDACVAERIGGHPLFAVTIIDGEDAHEAMEDGVTGDILPVPNADDPVIFNRRDIYITGPEGEPRKVSVHEIAKEGRKSLVRETVAWFGRILGSGANNAYDRAGW